MIGLGSLGLLTSLLWAHAAIPLVGTTGTTITHLDEAGCLSVGAGNREPDGAAVIQSIRMAGDLCELLRFWVAIMKSYPNWEDGAISCKLPFLELLQVPPPDGFLRAQ